MAEIRRILDNIDRSDLEKQISDEADERKQADLDEAKSREEADIKLQEQIDTNKADIATNKGLIDVNTENIATNHELINTNTDNINALATRHNEDKELFLSYVNRIKAYVSVGENEELTSKIYIDSMNMNLREDLITYIGNIQSDLNSKDVELQENIDEVSDRLNTVANSDDVSLDQLAEIVAYIKSNKDLIDGITTSKVSQTDFDALEDRVSTAEGEIDTAQTDIGNLQASYNAIPAWSLEATKPSYTHDEVGADPAGTASDEVAAHNEDEAAHSDIREMIETLINRVEATAKVVELWTGMAVPSTPEEVPDTWQEETTE